MKGQVIVNGQAPIGLTAQRYLIGRGDGCEILLPEDDGAVSRRHALLESDAQGGWSIVDLGSRNGTLVNGERLTDRRTLGDGDRIGIGKSQIVLSLSRSQPTMAVDAPLISETPRLQPNVAVEPVIPRPPLLSIYANASTPPEEPDTLVEQGDYTRPAPQPDPVAYERPIPPLAAAYVEPRPAWEPSVSVAAPPPSSSGGMGFLITGVCLVIVSGLAYFAYVEPKMAEYQSLAGQLAGGLMSMFGNNSFQQEYQTLVYERIGCIAGGFIGTGFVLAGLLKRR